MLARTAALAAAAVALLIVPAGADAAKVGITFYDGDIGLPGGYLVDYVADPGEVNQPTASLTALPSGQKVITFRDPIATISADPPSGEFVDRGGVSHYGWTPCTRLDAHTAKCVLPDPAWVQRKAQAGLSAVYAADGQLFGIDLRLGDRNDSYAPAPIGLGEQPPALDVDGGDGNDTIVAGPAYTSIFGGGGNDFIYAADGFNELVMCGDGTDHVRTLDPGDDAWTDCEDVAGR
jgi:hypothetical protein